MTKATVQTEHRMLAVHGEGCVCWGKGTWRANSAWMARLGREGGIWERFVKLMMHLRDMVIDDKVIIV